MVYIACGHHRDNTLDYYYCIAKLNSDMIFLAENPKEIKLTNGFSGADKPTLHTHKDLCYQSAGTK